ncbi:hypothetical protein MJG53_007468 [Ovis ammon polii x Ovis aries]|uniref:Uncharacterized protein n=1 Tax=Ovis ammon polii x Ovis aries TaxID=2918886 RepID=A0ACB9V358_9CETA|nr:hypothetical protein MJG53_007468 [Ovis ammon polii x Ovis aries]
MKTAKMRLRAGGLLTDNTGDPEQPIPERWGGTFCALLAFPAPIEGTDCFGRNAVDSAPHQLFSQDFQDQVIPGQETKAESSHSSMDLNENWYVNCAQDDEEQNLVAFQYHRQIFS